MSPFAIRRMRGAFAKSLNSSDHLHASDNGNKAIADAVATVLQSLIMLK